MTFTSPSSIFDHLVSKKNESTYFILYGILAPRAGCHDKARRISAVEKLVVVGTGHAASAPMSSLARHRYQGDTASSERVTS
jgi:hypothetical protein